MSLIKTFFIKVIPIFVLMISFSVSATAQIDNDYFAANQLLEQQKYEEAYDIFKRLLNRNPDTYIFFEKATECLINLKKYDEAINLSLKRADLSRYSSRAKIRLGEIYHIKGDTTSAYKTWEKVKSGDDQNLQLYLSLARAMRDQRAFTRSIDTYLEASKLFENASTIPTELARTYMEAGKYEKAINEYLNMLKKNPDRIGFVQSTMLRFNDDYMYDIAILEIDEFLEELSSRHPSHLSLHQLEVWLLIERELYERAYTTAKNYEETHNRISYSLFSIGSRFLSERKFELAHKAYNYYIENDIYPVNLRSMQKLAEVNIAWSDYLENFNIENASKRDSLYNQAYSVLEELKNTSPNYRNIEDVILTQSELALDHLHQPEKAVANLSLLEGSTDSATMARSTYVEGRINLYNKEYSLARVSFTRSNKIAETGRLAEKTRYFLALTDFFAGDYEFAKIQLNALERQNTSYFANDAVKLRIWIQDGIQSDSSGTFITPFAEAVEAFLQGKSNLGFNKMSAVLNIDYPHPLKDEALLELSSNNNAGFTSLTYKLISNYLDSHGQASPLKERLMWEQARLGEEIIFSKPGTPLNQFPAGIDSSFTDTFESVTLPSTTEEVIQLYEQILLNYPNGFYATFVRNKIEELQNIRT